jgi:FKBP-type peptidyl-prolyl cis-trans isomerase SlyD
MIIEKNKAVLVHYALTEGTEGGQPVENTAGGEPLGFIFGLGMMIPAFEAHLAGLKTGDKFKFGIPAGEAYGEYDPQAMVDVEIGSFAGTDGKIPEGLLQVGRMLPMQDQDGNRMNGMIAAVGENAVKIDFNHPMAGTDLFFSGHVESIREATSDEISHGHLHGEGGHTH